jgi:hypothetical protein
MSMSILNSEESRNKASLPPLSAKRVVLLIFLGLIVFLGCVLGALKIYPGPYREIDYMVIGTISVALALLVIFLGILANRRKLFVRTDEETV